MSDFHHQALQEQAAAFHTVAVQVGPGVEVPTCPGWDVRKLIRHLGRVYAMAGAALEQKRDSARPQPPSAPEDFDEALKFCNERLCELLPKLSALDQDRAVWAFFPAGTPETWTRRMAHETAIHRLDVEHALAGLGTDHVHDLLFDSELAADGVDELLSVLLPGTRDWEAEQSTGRVLYHAADAGRVWLVTYRTGYAPEVGSPQDAALGAQEVEATVAGTADALYRRVWGRPSTAVATGDTRLAELAAGR